MTIAFLIVALICFILGSIPPTAGRAQWAAIGLAFFTAAQLVGHRLLA